jgi:hypothetical protein
MPIVSKRSMVGGTAAAYYASKNGIVMLRGNEARVITETVLSKTDFQKLRPNTMIGGMQDNYYYGFCEQVAFRFRTPETENVDDQNITYTHLSDRPQAVWTSPQGDLYLAVGREISQWNAGNRLRQALWRSSVVYSPRRIAYSTAAFVPEAGTKTLEGQLEVEFKGEKGSYTRKVYDEDPIRLPNWFNVLFVQMELRGTAEVTEAAMATTIPALIAA